MKKFVEISIFLGMTIGIQSIVAMSAHSQVPQTGTSQQTSNQMVEFLNAWGFDTVDCQGEVINLKHDVTGEIGCAAPNAEMQAGNYIYNSDDNTISPIAEPQATQPSTIPPAPERQVTQPSAVPPANNQPESVAAVAEIENPNLEEIKFNFNNSYDYGACLDAILLAYEGRDAELAKVKKNECATKVLNVVGNNLSKDTALKLIKSADFHATEVLETKLYPSLGIRRRVAINLGYVYDIDKNNSDILKYISSNEQ
ncbi:MAG: hypothetical protein ACFCU5_12855 [Pleurocapsa sp.]